MHLSRNILTIPILFILISAPVCSSLFNIHTFEGKHHHDFRSISITPSSFFHSILSSVTNSAGQVIESTTYAPFGEVLSGGSKTRFGYESREYDTVVGDTDFRFRKYKHEYGIFLQPDAVIYNVYNPQNLNRYAFELNNPYKYTDPDGKWAITYEVGITGGVGTSGGTISKGIFIVINDDNGKIQMGSTRGSSGGANFKLGAGGNVLVGGTVNEKINDYKEFSETTTLSIGGRAGIYTAGLEYNKVLTDYKDTGYSLYFSPGAGADIHSEYGTNFDTHLWWESKPDDKSQKGSNLVSEQYAQKDSANTGSKNLQNCYTTYYFAHNPDGTIVELKEERKGND
jgi:RHS repeat-associated protein